MPENLYDLHKRVAEANVRDLKAVDKFTTLSNEIALVNGNNQDFPNATPQEARVDDNGLNLRPGVKVDSNGIQVKHYKVLNHLLGRRFRTGAVVAPIETSASVHSDVPHIVHSIQTQTDAPVSVTVGTETEQAPISAETQTNDAPNISTNEVPAAASVATDLPDFNVVSVPVGKNKSRRVGNTPKLNRDLGSDIVTTPDPTPRRTVKTPSSRRQTVPMLSYNPYDDEGYIGTEGLFRGLGLSRTSIPRASAALNPRWKKILEGVKNAGNKNKRIRLILNSMR